MTPEVEKPRPPTNRTQPNLTIAFMQQQCTNAAVQTVLISEIFFCGIY
jgi:hypothetical protein